MAQLHFKVRQVASEISNLPGFGTRHLQVIVSCDCNVIPGLRTIGGRLQGLTINTSFCLKSSLLDLEDQLVTWGIANNVDVTLDCKFGVAYTPLLNI